MKLLLLPGYRYPASLNEPITCGDLRYSFNLSRALARLGVEVNVLSRKRRGDQDIQVLDGVTIDRYEPAFPHLFATSFDISPERARRFKELAMTSDLVIANSPLTLELTAKLSCPLVYVCSGLEDVRNYSATLREAGQLLGLKLLRDPMKRATWRRAARVNTTAERERQTLVRMGVPARKISAIGPGVELERYQPAGPGEVNGLAADLTQDRAAGAKIVLSVSRFTPAKGLLETLQAFARLLQRRSDVLLVLVGVQHSH